MIETVLFHRSSRQTTGALSAALSTALLAIGATACTGSNDAGNGSRFCGEINENISALTAPQLSSADDIEPLLELYREIGELAPLSVEQEWDQLIINYETASTVVPGDDESEQRAIAEALRTEKSAVAVSDWLRENCAVDLGPVATIAPQGN